jgi:hypothetical protein
MSGFELLAIIRSRFPGIGVIVCSGDFLPLGEPEGILTDRFLRKGENSGFEIVEAVRELTTQLPIRAQQAKVDVAPTWLPRSDSPYVILTCPVCLRSSSVRIRNVDFGKVQNDSCLHCGAEVSYRIDRTAIENPSVAETLHNQIDSSKRMVSRSQKAIAESKKRIAESSE